MTNLFRPRTFTTLRFITFTSCLLLTLCARNSSDEQRRSSATLSFDEKLMNLTVESVRLSILTYYYDAADPNSFETTDDYDDLSLYSDGPDRALLARKNGYCFVAFRGSATPSSFAASPLDLAVDWAQNVDVREEEVCRRNDTAVDDNNDDDDDENDRRRGCCDAHKGFVDAYETVDYVVELEEDLRTCVADACDDDPDDDDDECGAVVLTGHSQGGGIAAVAAVVVADLHPYVITFGQPPTLSKTNCDDEIVSSSSRWYAFVNTKEGPDCAASSLTYDVGPSIPCPRFGVYGRSIVLGRGPEDVAYLGWNTLPTFDFSPIKGWFAHSSDFYQQKILELAARGSLPIEFEGFSNDHPCKKDEECMSGICEGRCQLLL